MKSITTTDEIMATFAKRQTDDPSGLSSLPLTVQGFYTLWVDQLHRVYDDMEMIKPFDARKRKHAKEILALWGADSFSVLTFVITYWIKFTKKIESETSRFDLPIRPDLVVLFTHRDLAYNFWLKYDKSKFMIQSPKVKKKLVIMKLTGAVKELAAQPAMQTDFTGTEDLQLIAPKAKEAVATLSDVLKWSTKHLGHKN
jgi:hypothetical protein